MTADEQGRPAGAAPLTDDDRRMMANFQRAQSEHRERVKREEMERVDSVTKHTEQAVARALGKAANNGHGICRWCGLTLGTDAEGNRTHPARRECSGPAPEPCELCHRAWYWHAPTLQWTHECTGKGGRAPVTQVERVQTPGVDDAMGGLFGYRRGSQ